MRTLHLSAAWLRLCAVAFLVFATSTASAQEGHTVRVASPYHFVPTLAHLRAAFAAKGLTVFAEIDHHAAAQKVGLSMPPAPDFALDLPLRVLVREDEHGKVWLVYDTAAALEGRHGLPAGMAQR